MESKYYYLQEGDVITEADEYRRDNGQWTLGTGVYGQVFDSKRHKLHRRWAESTPCASSEHTKDTNPKDAIGSTKPPIANVPLRDAMIQDNWTDDRPPRSKQTPTQVSDQYKQMLERLKSLQPDPVSGYTQKGQDDVRQA